MTEQLKILALSSYHGGSHEQFLTQWTERSRHQFTLLSLPPRHFKWRIRQASVGLAARANQQHAEGARFDLIWTTSMLDAAELRGLLSPSLRHLPLVVYFHENQLVYPVRKRDERNQHFSLINWASALASDESWFNSEFNRETMIEGLRVLLKKMPDENSLSTLDQIVSKSRIESLGVALPPRAKKRKGPLHIAWVGRWEHDKRPDIFFSALEKLQEDRIPFHLTVLGQSFRTWPSEFDEARNRFSSEIVHWGFAKGSLAYQSALKTVDVAVSTADHEFFGIALLEATGSGALPLAPQQLVYPEIYPESCLYQPGAHELAQELRRLSIMKDGEGTLENEFDRRCLNGVVQRYDFSRRARELDESLSRCHQQARLK